MVLAILGVIAIVAMPSLVKSIRGNRLRVGTRTIVMAANYARTSAILRNQEMKLTLDKANHTVSVDPLRSERPALPGEQNFDTTVEPPVTPTSPDATGDEPEPTVRASPFSPIFRKLDAVRIESITIDSKRSSAKDEAGTIIFQSNGRCTPFEARVVDEYGGRMVVKVDAVASIKVTQKEN